jgi:hypothetical protein
VRDQRFGVRTDVGARHKSAEQKSMVSCVVAELVFVDCYDSINQFTNLSGWT